MGFMERFTGSGSKESRPKAKRRDPEKGVARAGVLTDTQISNIMKSDADQELYEYSKPKQQRGMTDLIANHRPGNDFPFVSITGQDREDFATKVQRLLRLQPSVTRSEIEGLKTLTLKLVKDLEKISLAQVVPAKGLPYLFLSKATAHFVPMSSFLDGYSELKFSLMDNRMLNNQERQAVLSGTNLQTPLEFGMDHCIPRTSASKIQFCVSRTQANMVAGEQWGSVEITLELEESNKPFIENTKEVAGAVQLPSSGLEKYERDPTSLNIQLHENHRLKLMEFYEEGKVLNTTQPKEMKRAKPTYAKSSVSARVIKPAIKPEVPANQVPDVGNWDMMRGSRLPSIPDDQKSYSIPEEDLDDTLSISPTRSPVMGPTTSSTQLAEAAMKGIPPEYHGTIDSDDSDDEDFSEPPALAQKVMNASKGKKSVGWKLNGL